MLGLSAQEICTGNIPNTVHLVEGAREKVEIGIIQGNRAGEHQNQLF